jgi:hypothetical protein
MCFGKVGLEVGPGFVRQRLPTPFTARLGKEAAAEHDQVGVGDHLGGSVGVVTSISVVHGVFELGEEGFNGLGRFVGGSELDVVVGKLGRRHVSVRVQQVLDELACRDVGESRVAMLEGADIELVDGSDELLLESSIDMIVLSPEPKRLFVIADDALDLCSGAHNLVLVRERGLGWVVRQTEWPRGSHRLLVKWSMLSARVGHHQVRSGWRRH